MIRDAMTRIKLKSTGYGNGCWLHEEILFLK